MQNHFYLFYDEIDKSKNKREAILKNVVVGIDAGSGVKVPVKVFCSALK